jgi:hypothetical protein
MKKPRTWTDLIADPRVSSYSDERYPKECSEGLWLYLAPGWVGEHGSGCGTVHETTVAECCKALGEACYAPESWYGSCFTPQMLRPLLPGG